MEPMGARIRRQRRRLGLTLDELTARTGISKPYLSLIETNRVPNPPSDEKLTRIEQVLEFRPGELLTEAHLARTPDDVRAVLKTLLAGQAVTRQLDEPTGSLRPLLTVGSALTDAASGSVSEGASTGISLDNLYLSGMLRQFVEQTAGNIERVPTSPVPVINRVSAGYPKDFTDLSYPKGSADAFVTGVDIGDPDAFAARVSGDSMSPKYAEGDIVIFSPQATVRSGDDAFVRFDDGQTTFKRVFFDRNEQGDEIVRLQPRNDQYPERCVEPELLSGIWRAMFKYQSID
jgi:repressor LexA